MSASTDGKRACHHTRNFKGWPSPGLDAHFLPNANGHVTALLIGAVPIDRGSPRSFSASCLLGKCAQSLEAKTCLRS